MAFKAAFIAGAPDGNPDIHRSSIETSMYELNTVIVGSRNFEQATDVCKELVQKEGVQSIILCPGFTHEAIANIAKAVGKDVSVNVARGDPQSIWLQRGLWLKNISNS